MEIILRKLLPIVLFVFAFCACSKKPDCMIADSVEEIKSESLNKKGLRLYLRSSGFSEKEHFYELFGSTPSFDECGLATIDTLSQVHVDTSLGKPDKLIVKNNQIEIQYTNDEPESPLTNILVVSD